MFLFLEPDWPRRILNWPRAAAQAAPTAAAGLINRGHAAAIVLLGLHLVLQVLLPLRHFLYPGNVNWTEEGHRFSWHMKLRDKSATAVFRATDPATGETWTIIPRQYLTPRQEKKMAARPDMILQFCHFVADRLRSEDHPGIEVRAEVRASLNGRPPELLIDPDVNLAAQPRNLAHAEWILPLTRPLPAPHERNGGEASETEE